MPHEEQEELEFSDLVNALVGAFPEADEGALVEALENTDGSTEQVAAVLSEHTRLGPDAAAEWVDAVRFGRPPPGEPDAPTEPQPFEGDPGYETPQPDLLAGTARDLLGWAAALVEHLAEAVPNLEDHIAELRADCDELARAQEGKAAGSRPSPTVGGAVTTSMLLAGFGWVGRE